MKQEFTRGWGIPRLAVVSLRITQAAAPEAKPVDRFSYASTFRKVV